MSAFRALTCIHEMTLVVSLQVSFGQHWGMGLTLTLNVASQILLCLFIMMCYILHLIFEEGPGGWAP